MSRQMGECNTQLFAGMVGQMSDKCHTWIIFRRTTLMLGNVPVIPVLDTSLKTRTDIACHRNEMCILYKWEPSGPAANPLSRCRVSQVWQIIALYPPPLTWGIASAVLQKHLCNLLTKDGRAPKYRTKGCSRY